jgi:aspartyl-tRNA(Asn)/glutamyl-tRNA(Gln) amidotransferase subunit A
VSAVELRARLAAGELRVSDAVDASLASIAAYDAEVGAFHEVRADAARARAAELDALRDSGAPLPPLFGLPIALKENLCLRGATVACGSRLLAGWRAPYDATVVERLHAAGAVVVGMTHMDEFAMGSSGESSAYRSTGNPWDLARTPGGSSSGSAAAVAAGFVPLALGSDTGGSVRQPAALCGITGFKPTYGAVSRYGLVAFGSSLDQVSPLARNARDVALCFDAIRGRDPRDMTSFDLDGGARTGDPLAGARTRDPLAGARIGVPREHLSDDVDPGVRARIEAALTVLAGAGAEIVAVEIPHARAAIAAYYVVATAEASANLARFDGVRFGRRAKGDGTLMGMIAATREAGFGAEVKRRILLGTYVLSSGYHDAWYGRAQRVRARIAADLDAAFERCDLIAGPTFPTPAFRLGELRDDPVAMYLSDLFTVPANLAGVPAISLPAGSAPREGGELPVGLQLTAPRGADARLLAAAARFQELTEHHLVSAPGWEVEA